MSGKVLIGVLSGLAFLALPQGSGAAESQPMAHMVDSAGTLIGSLVEEPQISVPTGEDCATGLCVVQDSKGSLLYPSVARVVFDSGSCDGQGFFAASSVPPQSMIDLLAGGCYATGRFSCPGQDNTRLYSPDRAASPRTIHSTHSLRRGRCEPCSSQLDNAVPAKVILNLANLKPPYRLVGVQARSEIPGAERQ